ncbi:hypothetical protein FQA39_LY09789 [Lamprigera yunnana]|nr:hypothetical protein FQA39_LY09789 [Lamprigera yunnana]
MERQHDHPIPQWKKELITRLRNKNKWYSAAEQLLAGTPRNASAAVGCTGQQPNVTCSSASVPVVNSDDVVQSKCNDSSVTCTKTKMVKERVSVDRNYAYDSDNVKDENGEDCNSVDSSSSEELHYGPGIVNKLKNRYLSLTLRENNAKTRPSILPIRKATSLEHLLDDDLPNGKPAIANARTYNNSRWKENNARNLPNRYNTKHGDLKRARSVETISRSAIDEEPNELMNDVRVKHKSLHEDMLIAPEGNDKLSVKVFDNKILEITTENKPFSNAVPHIINRPKRITPVMNEKEKPPVHLVKQTKKLFEGKAEQRTKPPQQTGEVAAKVASYKNIISQTKTNKKPAILKEKPALPDNKVSICSPEHKLQKPSKLVLGAMENGWKKEEKTPSPDVASVRSVSSPIPDVSRINSPNKEDVLNDRDRQLRVGSNLSETPDLILISSPIKNVSSPTFKILATDNFLKAEVLHSNNNHFKIKQNSDKLHDKTDVHGSKCISPESRNNVDVAGNTVTYNLSNSTNVRSHLPINNSSTRTKVLSPPPIKNTHINRVDKTITNNQLVHPVAVPKPTWPTQTGLTPQEIEKNHINKAKTLEQKIALSSSLFVKCDEVKKVEVPKTALPKVPKEQNSIVFKFTDRKDVPDYVGNDGRNRTPAKLEKPKVGEGGIILLRGASLGESFTDDDDEDWMLSLEGPPSPCDVVFINDNVLIDGRSSLIQKNKKAKMRIKFVDSTPEIFEYPSEASLLDDIQIPPSETSPGRVVPNISEYYLIHQIILGSTLANYIPKAGASEDFQLGITRSMPIQQPIIETKNNGAYVESEMQEVDEPILFSAGTNSDILF